MRASKTTGMWQEPYYECPVGESIFTVDVTKSSPSRLKAIRIMDELIVDLNNMKAKRILDFGAGKLRNTIPLLKEGFQVYACEYQRQFEHYSKSIEMLEATRKYRNFKTLIYPHEFRSSTVEFDAILLIYVMNIIPDPDHRKLILESCAQRLKQNGRLLWVTPGYDTHMNRRCIDKYEYEDGHILNVRGTHQTFYAEFRVVQIDDMVLRPELGFKFEKRYEFGKNRARLYSKSKAP